MNLKFDLVGLGKIVAVPLATETTVFGFKLFWAL